MSERDNSEMLGYVANLYMTDEEREAEERRIAFNKEFRDSIKPTRSTHSVFESKASRIDQARKTVFQLDNKKDKS